MGLTAAATAPPDSATEYEPEGKPPAASRRSAAPWWLVRSQPPASAEHLPACLADAGEPQSDEEGDEWDQDDRGARGGRRGLLDRGSSEEEDEEAEDEAELEEEDQAEDDEPVERDLGPSAHEKRQARVRGGGLCPPGRPAPGLGGVLPLGTCRAAGREGHAPRAPALLAMPLLQIQQRISKLEEEAMADKAWFLQGEVEAGERPARPPWARRLHAPPP